MKDYVRDLVEIAFEARENQIKKEKRDKRAKEI